LSLAILKEVTNCVRQDSIGFVKTLAHSISTRLDAAARASATLRRWLSASGAKIQVKPIALHVDSQWSQQTERCIRADGRSDSAMAAERRTMAHNEVTGRMLRYRQCPSREQKESDSTSKSSADHCKVVSPAIEARINSEHEHHARDSVRIELLQQFIVCVA
jgi:hypothetical protein